MTPSRCTRVASPRNSSRKVATPWWPPFLIAIVTILVYTNSLSGPFVFDDRGTITDNPTIEDLGNRHVLAAPRETPVAGRPVANISFALNYAIGGRDVTGYHVVNLAIHLLCALALFGIARRTQPSVDAPRWRLGSSGRCTRSIPRRWTTSRSALSR